MYKCVNCGKAVDLESVKERIRCPFCGYRIISKEPAKIVIKVAAR